MGGEPTLNGAGRRADEIEVRLVQALEHGATAFAADAFASEIKPVAAKWLAEIHQLGLEPGTDVLLTSAPADDVVTNYYQGSLAVDADFVYFLGSEWVHRTPRGGGAARK